MRFVLISTFTLAIYAGQADAQPPAAESRPAVTEEAENDAPQGQTRNHARAAQRMARQRRAAGTSDDRARPDGGLPLSETVVSQPQDNPDPDR